MLNAEYLGFRENIVFLSSDLHRVVAVLAENHLVADGDLQRDAFSVFVPARADRDHRTLRGLLLIDGLGDDDAGGELLLARRLGGLARQDAPAEKIADARRELAKATLRERIREAVAAWPPLSAEDRADLAVLLLRSGDGDGS